MPTVICTYCGKEINRKNWHITKSKTGRFFCDRDECVAWLKQNDVYTSAQLGLHRSRGIRGNALKIGDTIYD